MGVQTQDTLLRALKRGELEPVYYFHGPEEVLKDEAIHQIVDLALEPGLRDFNLDLRSAPQLDPEGLHSLLNTLPMMAERRIVILKDVEGLKRKPKVRAVLDRYLQRPSADTIVVLVQSATDEKGMKADPGLAKGSYAVDFVPLQPERTLRWMALEAARHELALAPDAAQHLLGVFGNDLGILRMEITKLAALGRDGPVSLDEVASLVGVPRGETLYDWRDATLDGEAARAALMTGRLLERSEVSGVKLVTLLGTSLVGLGVARAHYDQGMRGSGLSGAVFKGMLQARPFGLAEWKTEAAKWARWAARWPAARIRAAVRATLAADQALKSTRISDERGVLLDLVLRLAGKQQEAA